MIIKTRDARPDTIRTLERRAREEPEPMRRAGCLSAAARLRADPVTDEACALIDRAFGDASDWAVLHDLRVQVGRHALHLCHLLVNDYLECVCIDTRYLQHGIRQRKDGAFEVFSALGEKPIASPLARAERDARMVRTLLDECHALPRRFGIGPRAAVRSLVLTHPALRISGGGDATRDTAALVSADAVFPLLWKQRKRRASNPFERVCAARLAGVAETIAAQHRPCFSSSLLDTPMAEAA